MAVLRHHGLVPKLPPGDHASTMLHLRHTDKQSADDPVGPLPRGVQHALPDPKETVDAGA